MTFYGNKILLYLDLHTDESMTPWMQPRALWRR